LKKLAFIINPVSGIRTKKNIPDLIAKIIDPAKFQTEIFMTERRNHGTELAQELVKRGFNSIVAVGGDGTVNEVAKCLLHTDVSLGVIPCGSGNGLARHLDIPLSVEKSLELINLNHIIRIDTGILNDHPFFCTSGVGFDAYIGEQFAQKTKRGFKTYIKTTLEGFLSYRPHHYHITTSFGEIDTDAFLITIGNTSQYGNNAYICPYADVQDGLLDVSIIKPFPKIYAIDLGRRLFSKNLDSSRYTTLFKASEIKIVRQEAGAVHIDGEPMEMGKELILKIIPSSLNVLVLPK
jgi:YegS/Rv2252/BmrU family lipid kinase